MFHSHRQQHDGYTSDTFGTAADGNCKNKEIAAVEEEPTCPNQWVAFSAEVSSSLDRVSAWVSSLGDSSLLIHAEEQEEEDDEEEEWNGITETEIGEPSGTTTKGHAQAQTRQKRRSRAAEEAVQQASSIVQTLNAFSSVAHISGMGLKAVPMISAFSSLRAVNLSGNFIAHISAGSLPKGLHSLDLSRNSIASIEGLRELTRLRVLSLSYNRIARIGHEGLSGTRDAMFYPGSAPHGGAAANNVANPPAAAPAAAPAANAAAAARAARHTAWKKKDKKVAIISLVVLAIVLVLVAVLCLQPWKK
ncbi:unnamed protein product [Triticum turgidum subsp. durum]|uniref:Uncharacterized protein n=1 Tax=Triticum turgidum subsp. durum TaxID=4567 RepID=A0A9R0SNB8_TRITD|nr:unnamed protein product [Triticum turgidum subsp. durum]